MPVPATAALRARSLPLIGLTLVALGVAGCSAAPQGPQEPETCAEFLELSESAIAEIYTDPALITEYTATGAQTLAEQEIYARDCASLDGSTDLGDLTWGDQIFADCDLFATLSADLQDEWTAAVYQEEYYDIGRELSTSEFLAACAAFDADNLVAASNYVQSYGTYMSWQTETRLGYRQQIVLGARTVLSGEGISHPAASSEAPFVAGSGCGFDPATDAAIPLRLHIVNTTEGQATTLSARFALQVVGSPDLTTTAYLEANYSDGPYCSSPAAAFGAGAFLSVVFQSPTESGSNVQSNYFVILKNYFSPRNPDGAVGELGSYQLVSGVQPGGDDPVIASTSATLSLAVAG